MVDYIQKMKPILDQNGLDEMKIGLVLIILYWYVNTVYKLFF